MLKLINKYKKYLIIASFAYLYLVAVLIAPSGYKVATPGAMSKTNKQYDIEGVNFNNNISTVSVYAWNELTIFQKWLVENNDRFDFSKKSEVEKSLTNKELTKQGIMTRDSSNQSAIINAYKYANLKDNNIKIDYYLKSLTVYYSNHPNIDVGDEIFYINDVYTYDSFNNITYGSYEDFLVDANVYDDKYINRFYGDRKGTQIAFTKDGSNNINTLLLNGSYYVTFYPKYEIVSTTPKINKINNDNSYGPSGGFMQSLAIYTALLKIDLGKTKISGTGTINTNNLGSVGPIGGIVQKYYTVYKKSDYFIVPLKHKEELDEVISSKDKIKVIYVLNFDEFINNYLPLILEGK